MTNTGLTTTTLYKKHETWCRSARVSRFNLLPPKWDTAVKTYMIEILRRLFSKIFLFYQVDLPINFKHQLVSVTNKLSTKTYTIFYPKQLFLWKILFLTWKKNMANWVLQDYPNKFYPNNILESIVNTYFTVYFIFMMFSPTMGI